MYAIECNFILRIDDIPCLKISCAGGHPPVRDDDLGTFSANCAGISYAW
jgi:hypothetical protein